MDVTFSQFNSGVWIPVLWTEH